MGFLASLWRAVQVGRETQRAVDAAYAVLAVGGSPVRALRAFAAETGGQLDDAVVRELEAALVQVMAGLEQVVRGAATTAQALADPRVRATLDRALDVALTAGYQAGRLRHVLGVWLDDAGASPRA